MTSMQDASASELHRVAARLADAARTETLRYFRASGLEIETKSDDFDPVTRADKGAERAIRAVLAEERPEDGILGEEFGAQEGASGLTWIVDPIDGTRGFVSGTPTWGVLIALADADGPQLGIIDQPYIGERFTGGLGVARFEGPGGAGDLRTRTPRPLADATLFTTFPEVGSSAERAAFERVAADVRLTRYGLDCYAYALVALGQVDLVIEAGLNPYDIAAPIAVIEAAGGLVTDWEGGPAHQGGRVVAAANADVHKEALARLNA